MNTLLSRLSAIIRPVFYLLLFSCFMYVVLQPTVQQSKREIGVVGDPSSLRAWSQKTSSKPTMPVEFEAWSNNQTLSEHFAQAKQDGYQSYMITWEPWLPVPANLGMLAQSIEQPLYSNAAIANGTHDSYIHQFAESVAKSGIETVYIRYAHEVNGNWYPWSHDNVQFITAWQHIVSIFRSVGASNAKFVYSTNPNLYQTDEKWTSGFWQYWPGDSYVDYVGSTMINFGSHACETIPCSSTDKGYSVSLFKKRIGLEHTISKKQLIISELNTALQSNTQAWLTDLNTWLDTDKDWLKGLVLSQLPSRGAEQMRTGNLSWNISDQPDLYPVLRMLTTTMGGKNINTDMPKSVMNPLMLK